jgi:hypothetical protein
VSFVSESLQTITPEKMTIEDEELFMAVAMQMYMGMFFLAAVHAAQYDIILV